MQISEFDKRKNSINVKSDHSGPSLLTFLSIPIASNYRSFCSQFLFCYFGVEVWDEVRLGTKVLGDASLENWSLIVFLFRTISTLKDDIWREFIKSDQSIPGCYYSSLHPLQGSVQTNSEHRSDTRITWYHENGKLLEWLEWLDSLDSSFYSCSATVPPRSQILSYRMWPRRGGRRPLACWPGCSHSCWGSCCS